jgi:DUF1680 family protein
LLGSLPEYIFSVACDGLYVNLFEPATIEWKQAGAEMRVEQSGDFPFSSDVQLKISASKPVQAKIRIRIPSWAAHPMEIIVNNDAAVVGRRYDSILIANGTQADPLHRPRQN